MAAAAAGKPLVDPEELLNASKLAKPAFALAFCVAGGGDGRTGGRTHTNKQTNKKTRNEKNNGWMTAERV